jgi:curved DNA-binding protein CbpA
MDRPYSLYDVLNVSPGASAAGLEAAYRSLMKRHHPDRARTDVAATRAAEINVAFSVLRDPERRADYDRREGARQRALIDVQTSQIRRRRRIAGWGAWSVAAVLIGVATGYAAQNYTVRAAAQRIAVAADIVPDTPSESRLDPARVVDEVLAEAAEMSLVPRSAPQRIPVQAAPPPVAATIAAIAEPPAPLRRRAERRSIAESRPRGGDAATRDFLEREEFIY